MGANDCLCDGGKNEERRDVGLAVGDTCIVVEARERPLEVQQKEPRDWDARRLGMLGNVYSQNR